MSCTPSLLSSYSAVIDPVSRLTDARFTPSSLPTARSTCDEHAEQVIPVTMNFRFVKFPPPSRPSCIYCTYAYARTPHGGVVISYFIRLTHFVKKKRYHTFRTLPARTARQNVRTRAFRSRAHSQNGRDVCGRESRLPRLLCSVGAFRNESARQLPRAVSSVFAAVR